MDETKTIIPKEVSEYEPLVRCVATTKVKNGKRIIDDAFVPREGQRDASILRLNYTDISFCIEHAKSLDPANHMYGGLIKFTKQIVEDTNNWAKVVDKSGNTNGTHANVVYSPMDNGEYVDVSKDYYMDSEISLPMHADLMYDEPLEKGEVRTRMRAYVNRLIKNSVIALSDNNGTLKEWKSGMLNGQ